MQRKKKKNFDSPSNAQDQWQIKGGREGFEQDSTYGQTMTTSQQRRQWHQLDNDSSKKEARFTGLGIKERERERERGERESDTN